MPDNAFDVLGVSPESSRAEIEAAREDALFDGVVSEDVVGRAESALLRPVPRLREELRYIWGVPWPLREAILQGAHDDGLSGLPELAAAAMLARANAAAACLLSGRGISPEGREALAKMLIEAQRGIGQEEILGLVNAARGKCKVVPRTTDELLAAELQKVRDWHREAAMAAITMLPDGAEGKQAALVATALAEEYQHNRTSAGRFLRDVICVDYKRWIQPFVEPLEENIRQFVSRMEKTAGTGLINRIEGALLKWDGYYQPVQLMEEVRGYDEKASKSMFNLLRDLTLHLHNEMGETEKALRLSKLLARVFPELPQAAELLQKDISVLQDMAGRERVAEKMGSSMTDFQRVSERIQKPAFGVGVKAGELEGVLDELLSSFNTLVNADKSLALDERMWVACHNLAMTACNQAIKSMQNNVFASHYTIEDERALIQKCTMGAFSRLEAMSKAAGAPKGAVAYLSKTCAELRSRAGNTPVHRPKKSTQDEEVSGGGFAIFAVIVLSVLIWLFAD